MPVQLVINTFGARLRKQGDRFLVQAGDRKLAVSAHKVRTVLIATGAVLSTDAVELAIAHNVDLVFLDRHGDPFGRVWQSRMGSTAAIRRRQLEAAEGPEGLALVRGWVEAKVRHQAEFLEELWRRRSDAGNFFGGPLGTLRACLDKLRQLAGDLEEQRGSVMGLEGSAGRAYFACLGKLVPEAYRFTTRSRQPATDEFNALLNYSYGVLYSLVERACVCAGLNPYVGFLHVDNYNKKSLVFDLIEPFRILSERATVLLFTGRRVQKDWFEAVPGGVALAAPGRAAFIAHFNERLDKGVRYPVQGKAGKTRNVKQRDVIQHEAHALANVLLGRNDLPRVVETRKVWAETAKEVEEAPPGLEEEEGPVTRPDAPATEAGGGPVSP
jgi:CRISPR-associated protein Cas1